MINLSAIPALRTLKILGILELLFGLWMLAGLISAIKDIWIRTDDFTQQEWTPVFILIATPLVVMLFIPAIAALRRWRHAWFWQIFGVSGLLVLISLIIFELTAA